jgi:hypothetical protein
VRKVLLTMIGTLSIATAVIAHSAVTRVAKDSPSAAAAAGSSVLTLTFRSRLSLAKAANPLGVGWDRSVNDRTLAKPAFSSPAHAETWSRPESVAQEEFPWSQPC